MPSISTQGTPLHLGVALGFTYHPKAYMPYGILEVDPMNAHVIALADDPGFRRGSVDLKPRGWQMDVLVCMSDAESEPAPTFLLLLQSCRVLSTTVSGSASSIVPGCSLTCCCVLM